MRIFLARGRWWFWTLVVTLGLIQALACKALASVLPLSAPGTENGASQTPATARVVISPGASATSPLYPPVETPPPSAPLPSPTSPAYPAIETSQPPASAPLATLGPTEPVSATLEISGVSTPRPTLFPTPTYIELPLGFGPWCPPWNSLKTEAYASQVFDGLTVQAVIEGKSYMVRYIGLDEASDTSTALVANRAFVEGKEILLVKDYSERDALGRLLRYVIADGKFVNLELIATGLAGAAAEAPDIACAPRFEEAEQHAVEAALGIWAPQTTPLVSTTPTSPSGGPEVIIWGIHYQGVEENESDEYVEIKNIGARPLDLGGWFLTAEKSGLGIYLQSFLLQPGAECRVYTNQVNPESCGGASIGSPLPVWRDNGECGLLKDGDGNPVFEFCY